MKYNLFNNREYEIHRLVLDKIKPNSSVLELGCATGYFSKYLKEINCYVVGVDYLEEAAANAKNICDKVYIRNLEEKLILPEKKQFDAVLLMDVIEHLVNRKELLLSISNYLKPQGSLILTTPNVANISIRYMLLGGNFDYSNTGLMDNTHVHFFTRATLKNLIEESGYKISKIDGSADFGLIPIFGRFLRHIPKNIQYKITHFFPTILVGQWLVIAAPIKSK